MTTFIIKKTDNNVLCSIADGTANTTNSSLVLFGKNYAGYGPQLDENLVKLLENFCFSSPPLRPLQGQLWWNTTDSTLNVYTQSGWKVVSGPTSSNAAPIGPKDGDLWWDTEHSQLFVFRGDNGGSWVLVGPAYTSTQGVSGALTETVTSSSDNRPHVIIKFIINGIVVAVLSNDETFSTNDVPGFSYIRPGFNLPTTYGQYVGNAENSLKLGNVLAANYLRSDVDSTTSHKLNIAANSGLTVGLNADLSIKVDGNAVRIASNIVGRDVEFLYTDASGALSTAMTIKSVSGEVLIINDPAYPQSASNKQYVDSADTAVAALAAAQVTALSTQLVGAAPSNMSTMGQLASALANNPTFATDLASQLALLAPKNSPALTGYPTAPTTPQTDASTKLATTEYVTDKLVSPTFSGNVTVDNITVNQGVFTPNNNIVDIGTTTRGFRTIYGTAMKANYADLAENYVADAYYAPGTVLDFGGTKEVTLSTGKDLTKVAGVVSSDPAYLMNAGCTGEFVVAVALQGRVPCRVIGQVAKGDLLVSYGDGVARRHLKPDAGTIIGKALEVHAGEESMIEIVVGRC